MSHAHAGWTPAEAKRLARQIDARVRNEQYEEYRLYAAESRACGYSPESFEEWLGETDPKAEASRRMAEIPADMLDLY